MMDVVMETETNSDLLLDAERLETEDATTTSLRHLQEVEEERLRRH